jgi:sulfatase modifying factor 1
MNTLNFLSHLIRSCQRFWVSLGLILALISIAQAQTITNVKASQQGMEVQISYDISDSSPNDTFSVEVFRGREPNWQGPLKAVNGDVGPNVQGGCCKQIKWQAAEEGQLVKGQSQFKVMAVLKIQKKRQGKSSRGMAAIEPEMVLVQGGTFSMGGPTSKSEGRTYSDSEPRHDVKISSFYMGKFEVTVQEFRIFVEETSYISEAEKMNKPHNWRFSASGKPYSSEDGNLPVARVSWNDCLAYITWLNEKTGKDYRLPTEAEWEYAAKGGPRQTNWIYSGSNELDRVGWYYWNSSSGPKPKGRKEPNILGIYDMSGNVWEWCSDWYQADCYVMRPTKDEDPKGPKMGQERVFRGGGYLALSGRSIVILRNHKPPSYFFSDLGFRLVLSMN